MRVFLYIATTVPDSLGKPGSSPSRPSLSDPHVSGRWPHGRADGTVHVVNSPSLHPAVALLEHLAQHLADASRLSEPDGALQAARRQVAQIQRELPSGKPNPAREGWMLAAAFSHTAQVTDQLKRQLTDSSVDVSALARMARSAHAAAADLRIACESLR